MDFFSKASTMLLLASLSIGGSGCRYIEGRLKSHPKSAPQAWVTPLPWIEISRESSPDGQVDAVLVTRRDSGPPQYLVSDPTDLYLVPRGVEVPREPPYPPYNVAPRPIEKIRAQTPFHGFEVIDPVIVWRGNTLLRVGAKKGEIHKRASEHTVNVGGQPVTVQIEYYIEWDSMSEEKGPALPVE